jgi:hypothetical protein
MARVLELPAMATEVVQKRQMIPASATQFPGSFGSQGRYETRKTPYHRKWRSIIYSYLTDGWNDISIWKSAVSIAQTLVACARL